MFKTVVLFVAIVAYSECGSISHDIKTCDVKDYDCQSDSLNRLFKEAASKGFPGVNIPVLDPYELENVELDLDFLKCNIIKGSLKGLSTCNFYNYRLDVERKTIYLEVQCDVFSLEPQYVCKRTSLLDNFIGDIDIHGEGTGRITFENKRTALEIVYETKKLDDGEVHALIIPEKVKFTFLGADKISVAGNSLYVGSQEISAVIVNLFNENWQIFSKNFYVKPITTKIGQLITMQANKMFAAVPVKDFIKN